MKHQLMIFMSLNPQDHGLAFYVDKLKANKNKVSRTQLRSMRWTPFI